MSAEENTRLKRLPGQAELEKQRGGNYWRETSKPNSLSFKGSAPSFIIPEIPIAADSATARTYFDITILTPL